MLLHDRLVQDETRTRHALAHRFIINQSYTHACHHYRLGDLRAYIAPMAYVSAYDARLQQRRYFTGISQARQTMTDGPTRRLFRFFIQICRFLNKA